MEKSGEGLVVWATGQEVWVETGGRLISCVLRGRFRKRGWGFQVIAGDRVSVSLEGGEAHAGVVEKVLPRKSFLSRYVGGRGKTERVVVANLDTLFVIVSLRSPPIHYNFIDRVLVSAERGGIGACLCLNKIDLAKRQEDIERFARTYRECGYPVIQASALDGRGVSEIKAMLKGGIYAFVGESGVGKSSLLMKIDEGLKLKVGELAGKAERGRHTTSYSRLYRIAGGYVADTPGIQMFGFPGSRKEELSGCFPEFRDLEEHCRFRPCTHSHEPWCAVKEAYEKGRIASTRYRSYLGILGEVESREKKRFS